MNIFQKIYYSIQTNDNKKFLDTIASQKDQINLLNKYLDEDSLKIETYIDEVDNLKKQISVVDDLETYWNNKRTPTTTYIYKARTVVDLSGNIPIDPRIFYTPIDSTIPIVSTGTNDEKAINTLQLVHSTITYTEDMTQFKQAEEWLFPFETWTLRKGDCEDGAILIANILLKSGIPYWRVRINAGDVKGGGHCWCTYLRESDNKWIVLDWCYWFNSQGTLYHDAENYYDIWFSFNTKYIYLDEVFEREQTQTATTRKEQTIRTSTTV